jgi:hypothetical protein
MKILDLDPSDILVDPSDTLAGPSAALVNRVGHRAKNQKVNFFQTIFSSSNKYKALLRSSFSVSGHIFCENAILLFYLKTAVK